jgi:hypothetical protein
MGTQLVAVRAGLVAALSALPEFSDFETTYIPVKGSKARKRCFTDNGRFSHSPAGMRANKIHRNEEGAFDLVLYVEGYGEQADPVTLSNFLYDGAGTAAEDFIATQANWNSDALGTTGLNWLKVGDAERGFAEGPIDNGLAVSLTYPIAYRARLT